MATFISLINWTDQGIRNFKDTTQRAEDASALAEKMGGKITDLYWTVGPYDLVAVAEFPDAETGTAYMLALGSIGNVRTTTLQGFTADQMGGIVAKVGG